MKFRHLLVTLTLLVTTGSFADTLKFSITNDTSVARPLWPVTGGVPLDRGVVKSLENVQLVDAGGNPVDFQGRTMSRWDDGSIKWVLLDFQGAFAPEETKSYTLNYGPTVTYAKPSGITVTRSAGTITIDTGAQTFPIDTRKIPLFREQIIGIQHRAPGPTDEENWMRPATDEGTEAFDLTQIKTSIETEGPMRTTVIVTGLPHGKGGEDHYPTELRYSFYRNSKLVKVEHTFLFDSDPNRNFLRDFRLTLPIYGDKIQASFGGSGKQYTVPKNGYVNQFEIGPPAHYNSVPYTVDKTVSWTITNNDQAAETGKEAPGWVSVSSGSGPVTVAVREFRHQHPKEFRVLGNGSLEVYLWPRAGNQVLDLRRRDEFNDATHYDLMKWDGGGRGLEKTHEIWISYDPAITGDTLAAAVDAPLTPMPDPAQFCATKVFGDIAPRDINRFPALESFQDFAVAWIRANQRAFHWSGFIDYGDSLFWGLGNKPQKGTIEPNTWACRGYTGWINDDGGLTHALYIYALRSGDLEAYREADRMARHDIDIDIDHFVPGDPGSIGGGHRHDEQHWGNILVGYCSCSQGAMDYLVLSGDEHAREVVQETANFHMKTVMEDEDKIGALMRASEILDNPTYANAAKSFLSQELSGGAAKWPFKTTRTFRFVSNMSSGLALYRTVTRDPDLDNALVQAADSVKAPMQSSWMVPGWMPLTTISLAYDIHPSQDYIDDIYAMIQRLDLPADLDGRQLWPQGLDALPFDKMIELSKVAKVNNIFDAAAQGLDGLPYAIYVLEHAGGDEGKARAFQRVANNAEPFTETLVNSRFVPVSGHLFKYYLTHQSISDREGVSTLKLYENGVEMTQAHARNKAIADQGGGLWSHYIPNQIWISTPDNSDPRTNGRKYVVVQP